MRQGLISRLICASIMAPMLACSIDDVSVEQRPAPRSSLVDSTGALWDVTQAVELFGFKLDRFAGGQGAFESTPVLNPTLVGPGDPEYPQAGDTLSVAGVDVGGEWRAYAAGLLISHVVINDARTAANLVATVRDQVTTEITAWDRSHAGEPVSLSASGWSYAGRTLLYDLETGGLWYRLEGSSVLTCVNGERLRWTLSPLPVVSTTWNLWFAQHPDSRALVVGP